MKYLVAVAVMAVALLGSGSTQSAEAGAFANRPRPLARLAEMERNKNAWLRSVFFNR